MNTQTVALASDLRTRARLAVLPLPVAGSIATDTPVLLRTHALVKRTPNGFAVADRVTRTPGEALHIAECMLIEAQRMLIG